MLVQPPLQAGVSERAVKRWSEGREGKDDPPLPWTSLARASCVHIKHINVCVCVCVKGEGKEDR